MKYYILLWKLFFNILSQQQHINKQIRYVSEGYFRLSNFTDIWPILDFVRFYLVNLKM